MPREYDTYEVEIEDWQVSPDQQIVELTEDQAQDLAVRFLEDGLELIESDPREGPAEDIAYDARLKKAIVTVLKYIDGGWGYYKWQSLADKRKHEANKQISKQATTGGEHGRTD